MDLQDAIDSQIGSNTNHFLSLVSFTILYYDYLLTFSAELERFWTPRWRNWASILFFLNRYLTLLGHIPVIYEFFSNPNPLRKAAICHSLGLYHQFLVIVIQFSVGALLILRTTALYDRSRKILIFLLVIAAIAVSMACWAIFSSKDTDTVTHVLPLVGCRKLSSIRQSRRLAIAWACAMVFDLVIFVMTVYRSLTTYRRVTGHRLVDTMLRDGAAYFAVMALSHLSIISTFLFAPIYQRGVSVTLANVISSTLISRLVLRLRDPNLTLTDRHLEHHRFSASMSMATRDHEQMVSTFVPLDTAVLHEDQAWCSQSADEGFKSVGSVIVVSRKQ